MNRRELLKSAAFGAVALAVSPRVLAVQARGAAARLAALEHQRGGRLGVAILDTGSGARVAYRGDERFLMCSTFKLLLVAAVLRKVDSGVEKLDRRIVFGKDALLEYAPAVKQHVGAPGMTVAQLCEAAVTLSDNTAANLLLASIGGPSGWTHYARTLGDRVTLLDRMEPELNPVDTTTPNAMLGDMQKVLLEDALTQASRRQLTNWMLDCQTGLQSLRAGLPAGWRVGDKTGQWDDEKSGANNDIAIVWPPGRRPLLVTAYYMTRNNDVAARKAVLAEVGRIAATL